MRARIAAAIERATALHWLGDEALGSGHFNADPTVTSLSRYRARTAEGFHYFTLRQSGDGRIVGVVVED
jgi:hypothetical protein